MLLLLGLMALPVPAAAQGPPPAGIQLQHHAQPIRFLSEQASPGVPLQDSASSRGTSTLIGAAIGAVAGYAFVLKAERSRNSNGFGGTRVRIGFAVMPGLVGALAGYIVGDTK